MIEIHQIRSKALSAIRARNIAESSKQPDLFPHPLAAFRERFLSMGRVVSPRIFTSVAVAAIVSPAHSSS